MLTSFNQRLRIVWMKDCKFFYFERLLILSEWKKSTKFRFESPISISRINYHSDFRRRSENDFKVFSDSRSKSPQKLILKLFADSQSEIICRLSEFFKNEMWRYTLLRLGLLSFCIIFYPKRVWMSGQTVRLSLLG